MQLFSHCRAVAAPLVAAFCGLLACALVFTSPAAAHIDLLFPPSRDGHNFQKEAPCGKAGSARSETPTTLRSGSTLTLYWDETIDHPGHYRISFDPNGTDAFEDPLGYDDFSEEGAVLVNGIADKVGGRYTYTIELPDIECDNCTLQLMQVMTDKPPFDDNDLYYACADLILTKDGPDPADIDVTPYLQGGVLGDGGDHGDDEDHDDDIMAAGGSGVSGGGSGAGGDSAAPLGAEDGACAVGGLESVPWAALAGLIGLIALGRRNRSRKPIRIKASKDAAKPRKAR